MGWGDHLRYLRASDLQKSSRYTSMSGSSWQFAWPARCFNPTLWISVCQSSQTTQQQCSISADWVECTHLTSAMKYVLVGILHSPFDPPPGLLYTGFAEQTSESPQQSHLQPPQVIQLPRCQSHLPEVGNSLSRSICNETQQEMFTILLSPGPQSWIFRRCLLPLLNGLSFLPISTHSSYTQGLAEDQKGQSASHHNSPGLAMPALVHYTSGPLGGNTNPSISGSRPDIPGPRYLRTCII